MIFSDKIIRYWIASMFFVIGIYPMTGLVLEVNAPANPSAIVHLSLNPDAFITLQTRIQSCRKN